MKTKLKTLLTLLLIQQITFSQNTITVYPDSLKGNLGKKYEYGVFYVPKTTEAQTDFLSNGDHLNTIRLHIIESALNNSTDLNGTLSYLDNVSSIIQDISNKTDKVIFILEKMPAWLSSSSDGSPAQTPGWFVLNTKPPANYVDWDNMVEAVTNRIVNTYGISNAYFEIWNEPDLGSWTGTQEEYFELFQHSYDAIKNVNALIPVGGPATNHWANNITYSAPFGHINSSNGELSLIAHLIDSADAWNKPLDFLSWHNFNLTVETHQNAIDFIENKYNLMGLNSPELFVSEWNAPSAVRDTDLHYAFAAKNTIALKNTSLTSDVIAAWQDFSSSANEFHADYGLLTYGSIRKPFFNVVSLASELKGTKVKSQSSVPLVHESSIVNDTLIVLMSNYAPPPIVEALNHTLFQGQFSVLDLDATGYIDISANDLSVLEAIYAGVSTIPNSSPLNQAINDAIPVYSYFDSIQSITHQIEVSIQGYNGNYSGISYLIDDSTNNDQFTYDSLLLAGENQASAIAMIQGNQEILGQSINFNSGNISLNMKPNSVTLLKVSIPGITSVNHIENSEEVWQVFPNPTSDFITLRSEHQNIGQIDVLDVSGKLLDSYYFETKTAKINLSKYAAGVYYIKDIEHKSVKILKQ